MNTHTQGTALPLSQKTKTAELHVVKGDLLSSVPPRRAALCRAFLGITGDGDSKPLCHSSGEKNKHKQNQTEKTDLQNKEVIPATAHLGPGPAVHDVQYDTKSHYTESFLPF